MTDVPPPPGAVPPPPPSLTPPPPPVYAPAPPPGYVAYGNHPTPTTSLRRVRGLSVAIVVLTAVVAVGSVLTTILTASVTQDANDFLDGELSQADFESAIGPLNAAQLLAGLATIALFVLTVIWMYRVATNIRAYQRDTTWSPLFAIFGWMLPPLLYVIPTLMLRELWKASDPKDPNDTQSWRGSQGNPLVWIWFALYGLAPLVLLVFSVGSVLDAGIGEGSTESLAETLDEFNAFNVVSAVVTVAAAVAWILLVRGLTARHVRLTNEA